MLNIANYQGNGNQNYNEVAPHSSQNGHHQKVYKKKKKNAGVEEKKPSTLLVGM